MKIELYNEVSGQKSWFKRDEVYTAISCDYGWIIPCNPRIIK